MNGCFQKSYKRWNQLHFGELVMWKTLELERVSDKEVDAKNHGDESVYG